MSEEKENVLKFVRDDGKLDVQKLKEEARNEMAAEKAKDAKKRIKDLLRKKAEAEKIVKNIDLEIKDLEAELIEE